MVAVKTAEPGDVGVTDTLLAALVPRLFSHKYEGVLTYSEFRELTWYRGSRTGGINILDREYAGQCTAGGSVLAPLLGHMQKSSTGEKTCRRD